MSDLREIIISITNRCNSFCRMCDIPKEEKEELFASQWKEVIKDAGSMGASTVVFSGGEPLLRKDIFELISFVRNNRMIACVTSNGSLINETCATKLSSSGIGVVNISLEGPKKIHDYLRGEGSFEKAILALKNLRKRNIESTIAMMVSHYNYRYLTDIVKLAEEYGVTTIKFQPFSSIFIKDKSRETEFFISKKEKGDLDSTIKEVVSRCDRCGIATNPIAYLEKISSYLSKDFYSPNGSCGVLRSSCPINPDGEIYPCWILSGRDSVVGNVKEKRLLELWGSKKHDSIRKKIESKGCPGCMMSCYDAAFGSNSVKEKIVANMGRLKKQGLVRYLRKWMKRLAFYAAYRGGLKDFLRRVKKFFIKKKLNYSTPDIDREKIRKELIEVEKAKGLLKEELNFTLQQR